ncbi:hypothetical protein BDN71DRAFT_1435665 [Pleurotus eryngii]|uniref:Peptidase A2 domain-containing protein n=1 Tax=Pleurotus eryngii TaxID=5323 RepID=A0A9P5ZIT6_PLEER|nr:hypothetical protein BDN71DRAFT_1435665 [Pleurotus eryngii]
MGLCSKRKPSNSAPPPPHSKVVFTPAVTRSRSMTTRKPSGAAPPSSAVGVSASTVPAASPSSTPTVAPASSTQKGRSLSTLLAATKNDPPPPLFGAAVDSTSTNTSAVSAAPAAEPVVNKGKEREATPQLLSSLESSPYVTSYPQTPHPLGIVDLSYDLSNPTSRMSASQSKSGPKVARVPSSSSTPSLQSLIPSRSATTGSLLLGPELENLFKGVASMFGILIKPLPTSVERWHAVPNLMGSEDPLAGFRSVAGVLPDQTEETSSLMRQQILMALSKLRDMSTSRAFQVDPQYTFLRSLEEPTDKLKLELMWETLLLGLMRTHSNIEAQLRSLYRYFNEPGARLSQVSFDSTEEEIHSQYGTRSPRTELAEIWRTEEKRKELPAYLRSTAAELATNLAADGYSVLSYDNSGFPPKPLSSASSRRSTSRQIQFAPVTALGGHCHDLLQEKEIPEGIHPLIFPGVPRILHVWLSDCVPLSQWEEVLAMTLPIGIKTAVLTEIKELATLQTTAVMGLEGTSQGEVLHEVLEVSLRQTQGTKVTLTEAHGEDTDPGDRILRMTLAAQENLAETITIEHHLQWNGDGRTLIDYLTDLATFSELDHFMDTHWIDEWTIEYEEMHFRQEGHSCESPLQFIQRRLKYSRFLYSENDDNDIGMVQRILRTQPACWAIHLNTETCHMVVELIHWLKTMNDGLIADWECSEALRCSRMQCAGGSTMSQQFYGRKTSTHNAEGEVSEESRSPSPTQEALAVDSRRRDETRNRWPRGGSWDGYSFSRDDSKTSDPPPRDVCWICTSPKHVHRDCLHYSKWEGLQNTWLEKGKEDKRGSSIRSRVARTAEVNDDDGSSRLTSVPSKDQLTMVAVDLGPPMSPICSVNESLPASEGDKAEDDFLGEIYLLECFPNPFHTPRNSTTILKQPRPSESPQLICAIRRQQFPEERSSLGIRALHMRAHIGSLKSPAFTARLDSGADVTLMSEDFLGTITEPPKIREGVHMQLYQLTGSAKVLGYVHTKLLVHTVMGEAVIFELEAYIVQGINDMDIGFRARKAFTGQSFLKGKHRDVYSMFVWKHPSAHRKLG